MISIIFIPFTFGSILDRLGFYEIPQGYKGVLSRFGLIQSNIQNPGLNWKAPYHSYELYETRWHTDIITNVECGSSQGGTVHMDIEVVNRLDSNNNCIYKMALNHGVDYDKKLIYDYIPSEVAQFCKNYKVEEIYVEQFDKLDEVLATALEKNIKAYDMKDCLHIKKDGVRIGRPRLSKEMKSKFEAIEAEQKDKDLAQQQLETDRVKQEKLTQKAVMEEERKLLVSKKTAQKLKIEEESKSTLQAIRDKTHKDTIISKAEADAISKIKIAKVETEAKILMADADKLWLTPERIEYEKSLAIAKNSKLIFNSPDNAFINMGNDLLTNVFEPI